MKVHTYSDKLTPIGQHILIVPLPGQSTYKPAHQPKTLSYNVHDLKEKKEKKNKSEFLHEAELPLKDLTSLLASPAESWLPELPGGRMMTVGGFVQAKSTVLIPAS